jgi:hypothetical protein
MFVEAPQMHTRASPLTARKLLRALRAFSLPVSVLPVFVAVAAATPAVRRTGVRQSAIPCRALRAWAISWPWSPSHGACPAS